MWQKNKKLFLIPAVLLVVIFLSGCESSGTNNQPPTSTLKSLQSPAEVTQRTVNEQVGTTPENQLEKAQIPVTSQVSCGEDYYRNVDGNCVHRPSDSPSGASAKCRDGSYSYSQHRQGTCSGHGGVAQWL